ncbi:DUF1624 domain-containing protein [Phreatobacter stygius]|uniref:DUF1624 domain-containing protein n=1 Tax=Phreatobacter stygius TaxID=1940610 RepID=UPI0014768C82|nr:heparan-alpha-glucosaminide N-acetyltransferase [Phreatobacter stygius]
MTEPNEKPAPSRRIDLIDLARGVTLLAMFVFHFAWDLSLFRLIDVDIAMEPGWRWFARCIAGSFLVLVGISLVLATRDGINGKAFLRRLAMVAGAAALVTLGTWFALPDSFVFFGILHHIALASVLALPFLRLPPLAIAGAIITCFALPELLTSPILDARWLGWLGLGRLPLQTADYVPVLPWFGCVLAGVLAARLALATGLADSLSRWRAVSVPARLIAWGGRHSLPIYLLHQPIFFAILLVAARIATLPAADARPFVAACERSCTGSGQSADLCRRACACTVQGLKRDQLWAKVLADTLTEDERDQMSDIAQACYGRP